MKIKRIAKTIAVGTIVLGQMAQVSTLAAPKEAINAFKDVREVRQTVGHFKGEIKLFIDKDGQRTRVDQKMKDGLRVVEGRTCVGVRDLVNAIEGAEVNWDGENKIVDITYNGKTISYPLSKPVMWNGSQMVTIDVPAQVDPIISRTFLPIRNIAETLGFKVDWNQQTKEVTLGYASDTHPGQATPTQKPKAQAQVNTENLSWVTAGGHKILRANELSAAKDRCVRIPITKADVIFNADGSNTYFKGTPIEFTTQPQFKFVAKSPDWSGFNLFGPSGNDPRVGTAAFQKGHPVFDKWYNSQEKQPFNELEPSMSFMPIRAMVDEYPNRKIGGAGIVNQIKAKLKVLKEDTDVLRYLLNENKNKYMEWYDFTGIYDAHISGVINHPEGGSISFGDIPAYIITKDGYIMDNIYAKNHKDKIVDKIVINMFPHAYVVDVPDVRIGDWTDQVKYSEGYYSINQYIYASLSRK